MGQPHRRYVLAVLMIASALSMVDRVALGLVLQDIKLELLLSDTQLGILTGIAFALFYSLIGLPVARWADRGDRVRILSGATALWSFALLLSSFVTSFAQLLLVRIGVAAGEAGCMPTAQSLIAGHFNREERPAAMGILGMAGPFAIIIGFSLAGWLNQHFGWRGVFALLSLPGLILAPLVLLTVREPRRSIVRQPLDDALTASPAPSLLKVSRYLWTYPSFRNLMMLFCVISFFGFGITKWLPSFFIRSYDLGTAEVGFLLAITVGFSGLIGAYLGGFLATRFAGGQESRQLRAIAIAILIAAVLSFSAYLTTNVYVSFLLIGLHTLAIMAVNGPLLGAVHTLVPEQARATTVALLYLFSNLIGLGFGPLATGLLSDAFTSSLGDQSLRMALLCMSPGYLVCVWLALRAGRTVLRDIRIGQVGDNMSHPKKWPVPQEA